MLAKDAAWSITGFGKGLGRALAQEVQAAGDRLAATARRAADLAGPGVPGDRLICVELDVTQPDQAMVAVAAAEARFGATRIGDYDATAGTARERRRAGHGRQAGDPVRAARAIIAAAKAETPPLHLLLGADALVQIRGRLHAWREEIDRWEELSRGTDFPGQAAA
jgi:NAD(P)-dependent dehydrogenase (short-subunit alcohol dehydrogenase family)